MNQYNELKRDIKALSARLDRLKRLESNAKQRLRRVGELLKTNDFVASPGDVMIVGDEIVWEAPNALTASDAIRLSRALGEAGAKVCADKRRRES